MDVNDYPQTYNRDIPMIATDIITERLIHLKKPKSHVSIDLPAEIVAKTATGMGPILARIINGIVQGEGFVQGEGWPEIWKVEEVTTIPKNKCASTFDEYRGISCTSIYSKLAETFMLDLMQEEISVSNTQYGGLKGVGTEHMLAEMTTKILEDLDDLSLIHI